MKKIFPVMLILALLSALLWYPTHRQESVQTFTPVRQPHQTLVIDAGHGGSDGGAVSVSGAPESAINLAIAQRLDGVLGLFGVNTLMLRTEDVSLHDKTAKTVREQKTSDLRNRVKTVNACENPVLISIHQNSFSDPRYDGAQVFYAATEGSQAFAESTQALLQTALNPENQRQAKPIPTSVYLMKHIQCKGILVECGFLSNPEEDLLLQTPEYQLKLAVTLAGSYLQSNASGEA